MADETPLDLEAIKQRHRDAYAYDGNDRLEAMNGLDGCVADIPLLVAEVEWLWVELEDATARLAELAPHSLKAQRDEARDVADRALAGREYAEAERDALAARLAAAEKMVEAAVAWRNVWPERGYETPYSIVDALVAAVDAYRTHEPEPEQT